MGCDFPPHGQHCKVCMGKGLGAWGSGRLKAQGHDVSKMLNRIPTFCYKRGNQTGEECGQIPEPSLQARGPPGQGEAGREEGLWGGGGWEHCHPRWSKY